MADVTEEFFGELGRRGHEPLLKKWSGTLRFDLTGGKRTERWLVEIKKGDVAVSRRNTRADCIVSAERVLFDESSAARRTRWQRFSVAHCA